MAASGFLFLETGTQRSAFWKGRLVREGLLPGGKRGTDVGPAAVGLQVPGTQRCNSTATFVVFIQEVVSPSDYLQQ